MIEALVLAVLGVALICVGWGPLVCVTRRHHAFGPWLRRGLREDERMCRTCGIRQRRENAQWSQWLAPPPPATPPFAETATEELASLRTGTSEIPRLSNGALTITPVPPRVAGKGHAVLAPEPLSLPPG